MSTRSRYARLLRLRHLQPSSWQRALFVEGAVLAAAVLVLADLASAWLLLAAPLAVAGVVKFHDALKGALHPPADRPPPARAPFGGDNDADNG